MEKEKSFCATRREFLFTGGSVVTFLLTGFSLASAQEPKPKALQLATYPRKRIARLGQLRQDVPVDFKYPRDDPYSSCFLVKLGVPAAGGVGPDRDIVAFSYLCSHMGGPLQGQYKKDHKVIGACPIHLTTFDLTRHGMVVAGHATLSLPQVVLEVKGDNIYATGVIGLLYGLSNNLRA